MTSQTCSRFLQIPPVSAFWFVLFESEVCVCDLAKVLNMTQSAVSHQLRILKQNKLVKNRREGKSIFYSLADDHVRMIISMGREHILE